ncbi:MAG: hypothetical protein J5I98_20100 [Phaeodactylibacter sp.]|nr:hypothetical protein [Phaeodactylibacter sp.]
MLGPIFDTLLNGGVLVVDELGSSMHPLLTKVAENMIRCGWFLADYKPLIERELSAKMDSAFKYEKNMPEMHNLLKKYGDREQAVLWAEALGQIFVGKTDFSEHNPSTKIYLLVQELLKLKG